MRLSGKAGAVLIMIAIVAGCSSMGATNTTTTNTAVTAFESVGATLTTLYNTEQSMVKAGTLNAAKDAQFQTLYKAAYNGYQALGAAMTTALTATGITQTNAQAQVTQLTAQLPGFITAVTTFLQGV
jgi:hypothetical protein